MELELPNSRCEECGARFKVAGGPGERGGRRLCATCARPVDPDHALHVSAEDFLAFCDALGIRLFDWHLFEAGAALPHALNLVSVVPPDLMGTTCGAVPAWPAAPCG
jgi:hypothetical protein